MTGKIDTLAFTGQSGRHYEFRVYVWQTPLRAVPAIYVVTERIAEPKQPPSYKPLFIGNTEDVSRVFSSQPQSRRDCFDLHYANTVAVLVETDDTRRSAIAQDLLAAFRPPCNGDG